MQSVLADVAGVDSAIRCARALKGGVCSPIAIACLVRLLVWVCLLICLVSCSSYVCVLLRCARLLLKARLVLTDCLIWLGMIGCLLLLCVSVRVSVVRSLSVCWIRVLGVCCRLLTAWTLSVHSPLLVMCLTAYSPLIGSGLRCVGVDLRFSLISLLGPLSLSVSPVSSPPGVILIEYERFAVPCMLRPTVRLTVCGALKSPRSVAMLRKVLLSDSDLTTGAKCVKIVKILCEIVVQRVTCGVMKIVLGYRCCVIEFGTVECILKICVLQSVADIMSCPLTLLTIMGWLCYLGRLCRLTVVQNVLTLMRRTACTFGTASTACLSWVSLV